MQRFWKKVALVLVLSAKSVWAADATEIATLKIRAEEGIAGAQADLAEMYYFGNGIPKDFAEAAKWYRKGAEQGDGWAAYRLGDCYAYSQGVERDYVQSIKWLNVAISKGVIEAKVSLASRYANGSGITQDTTEALRLMRQAASQGLATAQSYLGQALNSGLIDGRISVRKDISEAFYWTLKAAKQGDISAQFNLGGMFVRGEGVLKDEIEGLAWRNIATASRPEVGDFDERKAWENRLGPAASLRAQQRSKDILQQIKEGTYMPGVPSSTAALSDSQTPKASGSGALVTSTGYVLTAAHVVAGASSLKVYTVQGICTAKVVRLDEANDIAVLQLEAGIYQALPIVPSRTIRLGQTVATIGFPNIEIQGFSPKVTKGEISSLNGIGDDPRSWQISAPVQPGNSGGALLDENGNLVGVIESKLGIKAAQATGDVPQNVNYAIKSSYALAVLEPYLGTDAPTPNRGQPAPRFEDMVAKAQQSVVLILVY